MLVAIVFHAYFDVDVEQLLGDRQSYVSDKVSEFVDHALTRMGFVKWVARRHTDRLKDELDRRVTYQDVYKILKRYMRYNNYIIHAGHKTKGGYDRVSEVVIWVDICCLHATSPPPKKKKKNYRCA